MEKISNHITLSEAIKSQAAIRHGINNTPSEVIKGRMKLVAEKCFEPVREHFGIPIGISSFYRCKKLNTKIRGSKSSQHPLGEAIDIDADIHGGVTNREIFDWIRENLDFDQLIWEYGDDNNPAWVHVSYSAVFNRREVLRIP